MSRAAIVATLGPSSNDEGVLERMIEAGMNVARLNLSWGPTEERAHFSGMIARINERRGIRIPVMYDLSGPRIQEDEGHRFNGSEGPVITDKDRADIPIGIQNGATHFALSYVGSRADVDQLRQLIAEGGGNQRIIAKIERRVAIEKADEIIAAANGIMIARGDLGLEIPLETMPFVQIELIEKARAAGKPIIVATDMMTSMIKAPAPSRSDVTDVAFAALIGADAVMLSNETTQGERPAETVAMMAKILDEVVKRGFGEEIRPL